jgi:hypothetical protein
MPPRMVKTRHKVTIVFIRTRRSCVTHLKVGVA